MIHVVKQICKVHHNIPKSQLCNPSNCNLDKAVTAVRACFTKNPDCLSRIMLTFGMKRHLGPKQWFIGGLGPGFFWDSMDTPTITIPLTIG